MPKIVNTALKTRAKAKAKAWTFEAKAKAITFGFMTPRGQGLASRTTSLPYVGGFTRINQRSVPIRNSSVFRHR